MKGEEDIKKTAIAVLEAEAEVLRILSSSVDANFISAVNLACACLIMTNILIGWIE